MVMAAKSGLQSGYKVAYAAEAKVTSQLQLYEQFKRNFEFWRFPRRIFRRLEEVRSRKMREFRSGKRNGNI